MKRPDTPLTPTLPEHLKPYDLNRDGVLDSREKKLMREKISKKTTKNPTIGKDGSRSIVKGVVSNILM